jgi:hypothetical protein
MAVAAATPAFAQALDLATADAVSKVGLVSAPGRSFNPFSSLQLTASQANSVASLTLQLPEISGYSGARALSGTPMRWAYRSYGYGGSISISTPISKGSDSTSLGTLSGFADSTNATLQFSGYSGESIPFGEFSRPAQDMCKAAVDPLIPAYNTAHPGKPFEYSKDPQGNHYCVDADMNAVGVKDDQRLQFASFNKVAASPIWFYGINGTIGYQSHTFYDAATLAKSSADKVPLGAGGYLTYVAPSRSWSLTGQVNYQRAFKDNPTKVECPSGTAPVTCVNGAIGAPTRSTKVLLALEARAFESWRNFIPMGIAPLFTYDAQSREYSVSVPLYLYTDGKNGLTGGVRGDWTSVKHNIIFGVFITKAFDVGGHSSP